MKPVVKKSIGIFLLINFVLINGYMTQATKIDASLVEAWGLTELARVNTGGDAYTVKVEGKYCFISCGYSGFRIFDISNLSAPFQVAHIPQSANGYAHQFILHKNRHLSGFKFRGNFRAETAPRFITPLA